MENKDLILHFANAMLGDSTFIYTITYPTGIVMYILKDGKTIKLNSEQIQDLLKSILE